MTRPPAPYALGQQAAGDTEEYLRLMRLHGHIIPRSDPMPDPVGPRRFRVLVGYEFTSESEQAAYLRMVDYVQRRNEAGAQKGSDLVLTVGPPGSTVTVLEGELTAEERARVDAAEAKALR